MDKCGICDQIKFVKDIWSMEEFKNSALTIISIADSPFPNNNICEDCAKFLIRNGRINGKNGFGYRLPLKYQQERYKEKNEKK